MKIPSILLAFLTLASGLTTGTASAQNAQAKSYIVVDTQSTKVLVAHKAATKLPIASLTKVATTCVVLDWAQVTQTDLGTMVQVPESINLVGGVNPLGLRPGDTITYRDLLYGAMMASDNTAAHTLAESVGASLLTKLGRRGNPAGFFVEQMNQLAKKLGMNDTTFINPHGLDLERKAGLSTAADLARLAKYASEKSAFGFYTSQPRRNISYIRQGQSFTIPLTSTNALLGRGRIDGMKTGMTAAAGGCLILTEERKATTAPNPQGAGEIIIKPRLVVVVLGSQDRFNVAAGLLQRGWNTYDQWSAAGKPLASDRELLPNFSARSSILP